MPRFLAVSITIVIIISGIFVWMSEIQEIPDREALDYGVTFSLFRTNELGLNHQEVYDALIDELNVRRFRFVAHWDLTEQEEGVFDFEALDYQMMRAEEVGAQVTLAIGRRLPSWPECHVPQWAQGLSKNELDQKQLEYMEEVINRYKGYSSLKWWQVENEPFIIGYAYQNCGDVDIEFLENQIGFVHRLDPEHPVLLTASGELGLWNNTWSRADVFGTTMYRHVYNADLRRFITYPTTPEFFRWKRTLTEFTTGRKIPAIISELAAEPWPIGPIVETPLEEQLTRMSMERFNATLDFAAQSSFEEQYLWGAEWWYYLKKVHNHDEFWNRAMELF